MTQPEAVKLWTVKSRVTRNRLVRNMEAGVYPMKHPWASGIPLHAMRRSIPLRYEGTETESR